MAHNQSFERAVTQLRKARSAPPSHCARRARLVVHCAAAQLRRYMSIRRASASFLLIVSLACSADAKEGDCSSAYGTEGLVVALRERSKDPMYYYSSAGDASYAQYVTPELLIAQLSRMTRKSKQDPVQRLISRMKPDLPLRRDKNLSQYPGSAPYVQAALRELLEKGEVQIQDRRDPAAPVFVSKVRIVPIVETDIQAHTICFPPA